MQPIDVWLFSQVSGSLLEQSYSDIHIVSFFVSYANCFLIKTFNILSVFTKHKYCDISKLITTKENVIKKDKYTLYKQLIAIYY